MAQKFNLVDFTEATTDIAASLLNYDPTKINLFKLTQSGGKIINDFLQIIDPTSSGLAGILTSGVHAHYSGGYYWFLPQAATNRIYRYKISDATWSACDLTNTLKGTGVYRDLVVVQSNTTAGTWDIFSGFTAQVATNAGVMWARGIPDSMFSTIGTVPAATAVTDGRTTATTTGAVFVISDNNSANNILQAYANTDAESRVAGNIQLVLTDTTRRAQIIYVGSSDLTSTGALPRVYNSVNPAVTTGILATVAAPIANAQLSKCSFGGTPYWVYTTATQMVRFLFSNITAGNTNWALPTDIVTPTVTVPGSGNCPLLYNAVWTTMQKVVYLDTVDGVGSDRVLNIPQSTIAPFIMSPWLAVGIAFDQVVGVQTNQTDRTSDMALSGYEKKFSLGLFAGCAHNSTDKKILLTRNSSSSAANVASQQFLEIDYSKHNAYAILPAFDTPNATQYGRILRQGRFRGRNPINIYYRTSGISTNTGAWTQLDAEGNLNAVTVAAQVQFKIEFPVWNLNLTTAEVDVMGFTWTSRSIEPQFAWYQPTTDGRTYFIQQVAFGSPVPGLTIAYYVNSTNSLVFEQPSSGSANGIFEYWNGLAWIVGIGPDVVGTIRRFTPSVAIGTMDIRAELRLT